MNLKAQQQLATMNEDQIAQTFRNVFDNVSGQLVLEHLKNGAHFYKPSFEEDNCNKDLCVFNEGKRAVIISIETMMRLQPQPPEVPHE